MTSELLRKIARDVQCIVVGAVVIKAVGTENEKPEEWNRSIGYIEKALNEVREETIKECQIYFEKNQCSSDECLCGGTVQILSLLSKPEVKE